MYTQLTLGLGMEEKVDVRDLIVRGEIERDTPKARREQPTPEWERVLSDGADCAFRRRCGSRSQLVVMLATQGQCYVLDERSGARHQLTAARLGSFCKGATGDALTPPWSVRPLHEYDGRGRAAVVSLMGCDDFLGMCKRDMVRVEPWAASRLGANARWNLCGTWEQVNMVWRMVEPAVGHAHAREALSVALRLTGFRGEGRDFACAECFRDRMHVSRLVEGWGRDVARDLLRGYIDACTGHPNATMADFLPRLSMALRTLAHHDVSVEPRRACEYALHLLEVPSMTRHGRAYNLQVWTDCLCEQLDVRGSVADKYPANLAAIAEEMEHERELRRHRASDETISRRAAELSGRSFESDGHVIHPAASVREILDEANAQDNCVASFIDKYARGDTEIWLMRRADSPDASLVTVEVRDGRIRQAFQSHNRQVTAEQRRVLRDWCGAVGYRVPRDWRMRALGA
jgi:hypothetical protein